MPACQCPECSQTIIWATGDPVVCPWCGWDLEATRDHNQQLEETLSDDY